MFLRRIDESEAEGDAAAWYASQRQAWGYLPNYAPAFATRGEVGLAWTNLNLTVRGGMDRRRFELVTTAAARARRNTYCLAAHASFLRDVVGDEAAMRAVALGDLERLDDVDRALIAFAARIATDPAATRQEDVDDLRALGLSDAEIADVVFAVAARLFFATVLDATGALTDAQLGQTFPDDVRAGLTAGRPFAENS
ncbi:carboxymuconolactone decarboxylase family protein [Spongisporangium articulatum]|uniref:Carboxymuconolactone decarboxylase family protein n=1 Tax=Spongisporangium articulatum TaxID=3362603 RepID=A0ABW8AQB7_9ACTN